MPGLILTKHHGLGNDFLVLIDADNCHSVDETEARALCDRHRGVGADGVIRVGPAPSDGSGDLSFELRNADGSPAEMSGNGLRCLAQAALAAGLVDGPTFTVATPAGCRRVTVRPTEAPGVIWASVEMGRPRRDGDLVSMGNPHRVILTDDIAADIGAGPPPDGSVNVEWVRPGPGPDELTMRVFERGVGETEACGTGACAAAFVAHERGLVGSRVIVHQPGGDAEVIIGDDGSIELAGPSQYICRVEWDRP
jgi:diaminopimelate epimerase